VDSVVVVDDVVDEVTVVAKEVLEVIDVLAIHIKRNLFHFLQEAKKILKTI